MGKTALKVDNLFNFNQTIAKEIFDGTEYPWEALGKIKDFIFKLASTLPEDFEEVYENVWIGKGTTIESTAVIKGPAIIGYNCEIRHAAYIRENAIIGNNVVVGNSTEIKNSILFNNVQVPHYNYVGDSVLGYKSHLGAGAILSNVKATGENVRVKLDAYDDYIETNLQKFGALVGDGAEVGCNCVLNPGTILGKNCIIYPLTSARGFVPDNYILKNDGSMIVKA